MSKREFSITIKVSEKDVEELLSAYNYEVTPAVVNRIFDYLDVNGQSELESLCADSIILIAGEEL